MTSKKIVISIVFLIFGFHLSFGQKRLLEKAEDSFDQFSYIDAQKIYLDVAEKGFVSADLYKKLGDSYYFNSNLKESLKWYKKLYNEYPKDINAEYLFRLAQSYRNVKKYDESDRMMDLYNEKTGYWLDKRGKSFMTGKDYLDFIKKQSGKHTIHNLEINSPLSDYAPSYYGEALVFASSRAGSGTGAIHQWTKMPFSDLYTADFDMKSKKFEKPKKFKAAINTKYHESSSCFTKDGNTLYFTRNSFDGKKLTDKNGTILLKIYRVIKKDGKWGEEVELPFCSDNYSVAHPALSPDETKLYFASDMPDTFGQSDIFVVDIYNNGSFGKPKNMGPDVNSEGRETFPFVSNNNQLYYASDGHVGLGGLDVFVVKLKNNRLKLPFNVGEPLNSPFDDFGYIYNHKSKNGYFTSNRKEGKGSDDIYAFTRTKELITTCNQYVNGIVLDDETDKPISEVAIILYDKNNNELLRTKSDEKGKYRVTLKCSETYKIRYEIDDYSTLEQIINTSRGYEQQLERKVKLVKGGFGKFKAVLGRNLVRYLGLQTIYFDKLKAEIRPDAKLELQKIISALQQNPKLKIQVRSHCDSKGDDNFNLQLSKKRAQNTVSYITSKGKISKDRISGKGFGETQILNGCTNGVKCSKKQHAANRRSEFIIVQ